MRVMAWLRDALLDRLGSAAQDRAPPMCEGRVLHLVDDNPGGEVIRVTTMGRRVVRILDRGAFERACAAAMAGR